MHNYSAARKEWYYLSKLSSHLDDSKILSYDHILKDVDPKEHTLVFDEIVHFEKTIQKIYNDSRGIFLSLENLVASVLGGVNTNIVGKDTIFSDVIINNKERVSVKSSKQHSYKSVLNQSSLKRSQILSIIFNNASFGISNKDLPNYLSILKSGKVNNLASDGNLYSIVTIYSEGNSIFLEKSKALSKKDILKWSVENIKLLEKKCIFSGEDSASIFSPETKYEIQGISNRDNIDKMKEWSTIISNIKTLDMCNLRKINETYIVK